MITASAFVGVAAARGFRFWTGVPCSFLTPFINYVADSKELTYLGATSEAEAVAVAFGGYLGGQRTVAMCQNSGLGNMVNPLTSLNYPFRVPTLIITTHRGAPGIKDEPQHELMGQVTSQLLDVLGIPWRRFPETPDEIESVLAEAAEYMDREGRPFALIMARDAVEPCGLRTQPTYRGRRTTPIGSFTIPNDSLPKRLDAIRAVRDQTTPSDLLIGTTGKTGRELYALGHASNQFYVVGGMGCAAGIGLGLSLTRPDKRVIVLDGDGAALMKMGTLASIGHYSPSNLVHVLLDNRAHESTGAQWTVSGSVDWAEVAAACGYAAAYRSDSCDGLGQLVAEHYSSGPKFIHMRIAVGSDPNLPRPHLTPRQVKDEFTAGLHA